MEQKQLDELEESSFGEEFIDDDLDFVSKDDDTVLAKAVSRKEVRAKRSEEKRVVKKSSVKAAKTTTANKSEKANEKDVEKPLSIRRDEDSGEVRIFPTKELSKAETAKTAARSGASPVESKAPDVAASHNPWAETESSERGLFTDVSTWKAITGIAIILLLLSVFTQGFRFSATGAGVTAGSIPLKEAEVKALEFVNSQLLQPPFEAEVASAEEVNNLYKITLMVAGQSVDSYITKDGMIFFPQGFNTEESTSPVSPKNASKKPATSAPLETRAEPSTTTITSAASSEEKKLASEEAAAETPVSSGVRQASLKYYKWTFSPLTLRAKQGETVRLTLAPDSSKSASLQLDEFTFEIPRLGVRQQVSGTTKVEFAAAKAGKFRFLCSSCRDSSGVMEGELVVE